MWYPADPYENYGSDDYLIELMGWSQRIRERLENNPLSVRIDQLPAILPMLSVHHHFAEIGEQMKQENIVSPSAFLEALGDDFTDNMHGALRIALCHAPESFLDNFSLNDSVHLLELLEEVTHFMNEGVEE